MPHGRLAAGVGGMALAENLPPLSVPPPATHEVAHVPVEERHTERAHVTPPTREPHEAERREAELVQRYRRALNLDG